MLTRIRIVPYNSSSRVDINYNTDPVVGGYDLISATGLEPPNTNVHYSDYAQIPGGRYHSATTGIRNLVIRVGLLPAPELGKTVLNLRRELYHTIPSGERLQLRLWNDGNYEMIIDGYVESIEHDPFVAQPEAIISIVCPVPFFRLPSDSGEELIPAGESRTVVNNGDVPTGINFLGRIYSSFTGTVRLVNDTTGDYIQFSRDWAPGNRLRIVTTEGSREASLRNSSLELQRHLLGIASVTGDWPRLVPGENRIRAFSSSSSDWAWDYSYRELYGGF